ncbi:hypothetical protein V8C26DRAFT_378559 [Trichoderma gracile]
MLPATGHQHAYVHVVLEAIPPLRDGIASRQCGGKARLGVIGRPRDYTSFVSLGLKTHLNRPIAIASDGGTWLARSHSKQQPPIAHCPCYVTSTQTAYIATEPSESQPSTACGCGSMDELLQALRCSIPTLPYMANTQLTHTSTYSAQDACTTRRQQMH